MTSMIAVQIVGLQLDGDANASVVLLAESDEPTRVLPIIVGQSEAQSIALAATGVELPRPGTHDLMIDIIERTGCRLEEVAVTELRDGIFYAELFVESPSGLHRISSRPSDGIALAMRVGAPIFVRAEVLDDAAIMVTREASEPFDDEEIDRIVEEFQEGLATVRASDFATASASDAPATDEADTDAPDTDES